jgi:hypothetical protein
MIPTALFVWLISHQSAVLFSQNKPTTSNQTAVLFSQNKSTPATSHQPNKQAYTLPLLIVMWMLLLHLINFIHTLMERIENLYCQFAGSAG